MCYVRGTRGGFGGGSGCWGARTGNGGSGVGGGRAEEVVEKMSKVFNLERASYVGIGVYVAGIDIPLAHIHIRNALQQIYSPGKLSKQECEIVIFLLLTREWYLDNTLGSLK